jgi:CheY-like chemotaxis protein
MTCQLAARRQTRGLVAMQSNRSRRPSEGDDVYQRDSSTSWIGRVPRILPVLWLAAIPAAIREIKLGEKVNGQKTVLCIDDQALPLLILKILLVHAGYAVLTAEAGQAGLQLFGSEEVHAVVLHYSRGETGCGVVAARMKHLKPEIPIIMLLSSADESADAVPVVDALMRKPESPNVLLAKLSEVLYGNCLSADKKPPTAKPTKTWVA